MHRATQPPACRHIRGRALRHVSTAALLAALTAPVAAYGQAYDSITVTAQRRAENIQEVPIAISAFDESAIERQGLDSVQDLVGTVPTLTFTNFSTSVVTQLRGVGFENTTSGGDPGVTLHIDGVYLGRPIANMFDNWDLERIEVLRGPQGTLYGRNSTGGNINFITQKPGDELEAVGEVVVGNYNRIAGRIMANLPLDDYGGFRFNFTKENRDGFQENLFPGREDAQDADNTAFRGHFQLNPTDNLQILLSGYLAEVEGVGPSHENRDPTPVGQNAVLPGGFPYPAALLPGEDQVHIVNKDGEEFVDNESNLYSGTITYDLGAATFKSITAYAELSYDTQTDLDDSASPIFNLQLLEDQDQFTQEFQLASASDGALEWIVGAYYFEEEAFRSSRGFNPVIDGIGAGAGRPAGFDVGGTVEAESYALFVQGGYQLTDQIKANAGFRFTWDEKTANLDQFIFGGAFPVQGISQEWEEPIYNFGVDYQLTDAAMLFAKYSRGYKSGGVNLNANFGAAGLNPADPADFLAIQDGSFYEPEFIKSFEVGLKSNPTDASTANVSFFYNTYEDLQINQIGPLGAVIENAAEATMWGIEFEGDIAVTENFILNGTMGYLNAEYDDFPSNVNDPTAPNFAGNRVNRAPDWTGSIGAQYSIPTESNGEFVLRADASYTGERFFEPDNCTPRGVCDLTGGFELDSRAAGFYNLNTRLFWYTPWDGVTGELFVLNATDEEQVQNILGSLPFIGALGQPRELTTYNPPRQYGARINVRFH